MESLPLDVGKTFLEKWITGAIEKSRYLFCFKSIAEEFNKEKEKLEADRKTMRQRLRVAIEKDKDIQFNAQFWQEQAEKLIQEDTKTNQRCFFGFCPDCIWRYKRGEKLANKIGEIKKLVEEGKNFENIELARRLPDVERYSSQYYISFKSRELKYQELLNALKDDSYYIIGLHGMGGTGKTTLAKEVGKQLKASMQFNRVIITTVSNPPNIQKIQDDIAGPLGLEWRDINESDRPNKLWNRLTNGEKILVILDDVWGYLNFDDIGIPNIDNHKGCKVLVTTRTLGVCNKMACDITIQLELLSEEDAWAMFKRHADLSDISSNGLLKQGRKIADECKGLPVAIATIASSLRGQKRQVEWDVALQYLQNPMSMGVVDDSLVDIYKCLKFSYDNLTDKKAKELFLLCSVFHEDEEISTEILTRLGIGVGLIGEGYDKYNYARKQVVVAKNKLLDSCLLLNTIERGVKMHDLIREVAQWIANKEILTVDSSNKNQKSSLVGKDNNIKYLLFDGNPMDLCSSGFDGSKLEILILIMVTGCFVDSFFENIARLRVLNLIASKEITLSLPQSIQSLTNIRSLLIESVDLGDISVLGSLQSLETLDLNRCSIKKLPQEIAVMKKLRLLNLEDCFIHYNNPFKVIQRCPSLEELYFLNSFNNFCQEISFEELERYQIIEGYREMYDFSVSKCVSLEQDYFSEATFKYVIQTAEILKLERIKKGWRNLMPEIVPIDEGMNDLIELDLEDDSQLQYLVDTKHNCSRVPNVFSKLVELKLQEMNCLKELCNGSISFDSLNKLEYLFIEKCKDLGSLFKCSLNLDNLKTVRLIQCSTLVSVFDLLTSQCLILLGRLVISDCMQLRTIVSNERKSQVDGGNDNSKTCNSLFPKLKVVNIEYCPRLQFIFPLFSAKDLLLLEDIEIKACDNLKHIFGKHQDLGSLFKYSPKLSNLKTVTLRSCSTLVYVFDLSTSQSLLLLERLVISDCKQLENIFTNERKSSLQVDGDNDNNKSWNSLFPNLKIVNIEYCDQVQFIFPLVSEKDLLLLEAIEIKACGNLKHIFGKHQNVELASLKELRLYDLANFIGIFPESSHSFEVEGSSHSISKPQTELEVEEEPSKSNKFPWSHVCCYGYKLRDSSSTSTKIPIPSVYEDQPQHCSISSSMESYCLLRLSHVMCNIKVIELMNVSKIKSVFVLSIAPKMLWLERLCIIDCGELKHIVEDIGDGSGIGVNIVFPNLKELYVYGCKNLEYIFGHINASDHQYSLSLPALISLDLQSLPTLFGMGTKNYRTMLPHLVKLELLDCPQVANESIGDFVYSMSKSQDTTIIKDLCGNELEALENLKAKNTKFQCIFYLDETNGHQRNLGLQGIDLDKLTQMTYLFVGPRNCFSLKNLLNIKIVRCEKLKIIFSTCVLKCLPQLVDLMIDECDELQYIIKDDDDDDHVENKEISNDHMHMFPKLETLVVRKCGQLRYVFSASMCTKLPELWFLMVQEAANLEKIFGGNEEKVGIPNLNIVVFVELPSFFQGLQFQTVQHRLVHNCQKLSLTSSAYIDFSSTLKRTCYQHKSDYDLTEYMWSVNEQLEEHFKTKDTSGGNLNGTEIRSSTSENENAVESNQYKIDSGLEIPSIADSQCLKESEDQNIQEGSTSKTRNDPPMQLVADLKQKDIKLSFKDIDLDDSKETTLTKNQDESNAAPRHELTSSQIKIKQASEAEHECVKNVPDLEIPPGGEFDKSFSIATKKGFSERFVQLNNKQYLGLSVAVVGISVVAGFLYLRKK